MNAEPLAASFERKFAFSALFAGLLIIVAKTVLGNASLLDAASEIVGGKENAWFVLMSPFNLAWRFSWFLVCLVVGILFTWLSYHIVYLDSSVPGVQPPSPFSPSKQNRAPPRRAVYSGYLFAFINGFLVFIYMFCWW